MYKSRLEDFTKLNIFTFIKNEALKLQIVQVIKKAEPLLNSINGEFKEYTMHDIGHSYRVAKYMDQMALGLDKKKMGQLKDNFSDLEFALMIVCAVLHDIGMHYTDDEAEKIKNSNELFLGKFKYQGVLKSLRKENPSATEKQAMHEVIRRLHHLRASEYIKNSEIKQYLKLDDTFDFSEIVGAICQSHGEGYSFVRELKIQDKCGDYSFDARYIAVLLRIADYIDIDGQRTPLLWYNLHKPQHISKREWQKHFIISNKEKFSEVNGKLQISFYGKSTSPEIHRSYLKYIDDLRKELVNAVDTLERDATHFFMLIDKLEDNVTTEGFDYVDLRLNLDYNSITELLMGVNIYHDKRLGLRELIQNSIDACKLRQERAPAKLVYAYAPQIIIDISQTKGYVKIIDNGTGMDLNIIKNYFLNVGISYYTSEEFDNNDYSYKPIGKFGIGFLACYLLSNKVHVKTKHFISHESVEIELERGSEYVVTKRDSEIEYAGTEIELDYQDFFNVFEGIEDLKKFIGRYFFTDIPIQIVDSDSESELSYSSCANYFQSVSATYNETEKFFIENLVCNNFWENLKGNILIRYKDFEIPESNYDQNIPVFLYNSKRGLFEEVFPVEVQDGNYFEFFYPVLLKQDLPKIKNAEERDNELYLLAQNRGKLFRLLVPGNISYDFDSYSGKLNIESVDFDKILEKSKILPLGISARTIRKNACLVYKHGLKGLQLRTTRIFEHKLSPMDNLPDSISFQNEVSLFYRDIYVKNASCGFIMPFNFRILGGCINNLDPHNRLSLNVARQGFVSEKPYMLCIFYVILKFFDDCIKVKSETLRSYLDMQYDKLIKEFE